MVFFYFALKGFYLHQQLLTDWLLGGFTYFQIRIRGNKPKNNFLLLALLQKWDKSDNFTQSCGSCVYITQIYWEKEM